MVIIFTSCRVVQSVLLQQMMMLCLVCVYINCLVVLSWSVKDSLQVKNQIKQRKNSPVLEIFVCICVKVNEKSRISAVC